MFSTTEKRKIAELQSNHPEMPKEWINVDDKLPETDTYVLVCLHGKFIRVSYFFEDSHGHWFSSADHIWDIRFSEAITHWMPLPALPEQVFLNRNVR